MPIIPLITMGVGAVNSLIQARQKGRADARVTEAASNQNQDQNAIELAKVGDKRQTDLADIDIKRREDARTSYNDATAQAVRGGLLTGTQDFKSVLRPELEAHRAQTTGGLRPSAITGKDEIGALLKNRATERMLNGEKYDPVSFGALPELTPQPSPTNSDKWLDRIGTATGLGSAALESYGAYKNAKAGDAEEPASYIPPPQQIPASEAGATPLVHPALRGLKIPIGATRTVNPSLRGVKF